MDDIVAVFKRIISGFIGFSFIRNPDRMSSSEFEAEARRQGLIPIKVKNRCGPTRS